MDSSGSYKTSHEPNGLGKPAIEGDSPVGEVVRSPGTLLPSSTGHVESRVNPGGPPSKAKYSQVTDSELSTVRER